MIIQTERLILRPFEDKDFERYYNLLQEVDVKETLLGIYESEPEKVKEHIELFKKGDFENDFYMVVADKNTNELIGIIMAVRIVSRMVDVSYGIMKAYRGNGYIEEAMNAFMEKARMVNPVYCFRFMIKPENKVSIHIVEKLGADLQIEKKDYLQYYL